MWHGIAYSTAVTEAEHKLKVNSSPPEQNGRHFADDIFKHIFLNENVRIAIKI